MVSYIEGSGIEPISMVPASLVKMTTLNVYSGGIMYNMCDGDLCTGDALRGEEPLYRGDLLDKGEGRQY